MRNEPKSLKYVKAEEIKDLTKFQKCMIWLVPTWFGWYQYNLKISKNNKIRSATELPDIWLRKIGQYRLYYGWYRPYFAILECMQHEVWTYRGAELRFILQKQVGTYIMNGNYSLYWDLRSTGIYKFKLEITRFVLGFVYT